jgi:hypothetical protein
MKAPLFFALVFLAPLVVTAQSTEPMKTKALSYSFDGTSSVGGKIWISDQSALTLSVGGAASSTRREAADTSEIDDEYSSSNVTLVVGVEQHLDLGWDFSPYLTAGLSIGRSGYVSSSGTTAFQYETESVNTSVGLRAGFGIEYWLTRRISLAGQQIIQGTYGLGEYSSGLVDPPSQDSRSFDLSLGTSALILSVYL